MPASEFSGTERYGIVGRIGQGGMGVVYRAVDRERGLEVALKTLARLDGPNLWRLKREFRALADVHHPNLVTLHELVSAEDQWFFTMELVEGRELLDALEGDRGDRPQLRAALSQLALGVAALHEAGKLHLDLKPSNVLVSPSGRVVLLDFGLVGELEDGHTARRPRSVSGTPGYLAPEVLAGGALSPATDWYAVGVMLYEALTGARPFEGGPLQILAAQEAGPPVPPQARAPDVPLDLSRLCMDLLDRAPEARPTGAAVLAQLGVEPSDDRRPAAPGYPAPFIGRGPQIAQLTQAFLDAMRNGRPTVVCVHGKSGMGKSELLADFAERLCRQPETVVLQGRCYERETVAYKAIDGLVDSMSQHLVALGEAEVQSLLPPDAGALARLFPVLRRVPAIADALREAPAIPDAQEARRRGFVALRAFITALAEARPLVLLLDDLQWGDADGAAALAEVLRPPGPPVLVVVAYRSDEADESPFLRVLLGALAAHEPPTPAREIVVGPLSTDEASTLSSLLGRDAELTAKYAPIIASESGGSPFFVGELVRFLEAQAAAPTDEPVTLSGRLTLEGMILARLGRLGQAARRLLEIAAVAGGPLPRRAAADAAELGVDDWHPLAALRAARLVRTRSGEDGEALETAHDRIRETLISAMPAWRLRDCHARLARALEALGAQPEAFVFHLRGAGESMRAGEYAARAADRAADTLAFDRAADLYRLALALDPTLLPDRRRVLSRRLGDALAAAGRGADAADAYRAAARDSPPGEGAELVRLAAEQLLRSGHTDAGMALLADALAGVGLRLASSPRAALASLLVRRARLALRRLHTTLRKEADVPQTLLLRIDLTRLVSVQLGMLDFIRGAEFHARHLTYALDAGEPGRLAMALSAEAVHSAARGARGAARADAVLAESRRLAAMTADARAEPLTHLSAGICATLQGRWQPALDEYDAAETGLRAHCHGVAWEIATAQSYRLVSLFYLGRLGELCARLDAQLREADLRGDRYAAFLSRTSAGFFAWLVRDDPARLREEIAQGLDRWSQAGFQLPHFYALVALVNADLYDDDGAAAWQRLEEAWPTVRASLLLRLQYHRILAHWLRGKSAIAAAAHGVGDQGTLLDIAHREAQRIESERAIWATPLAVLLRGTVSALRGDGPRAQRELEAAARGCEAVDLHHYAAIARLAAGTAGGAGDSAAADALGARLSAEGVRRPDRWITMLTPGLPRPRGT